MPRVFLLTNCDEVDVKSVANNDEEEDTFKDDDDTNSDEDVGLLNFSFVPGSKTVLVDIVDLTGEDCKFDFLLLLSVILSSNRTRVKFFYVFLNSQTDLVFYVLIDFQK